MNMNRILRLQLVGLLIVTAALLAGCGPREAGSGRTEGMDIIPVVITSPITTNIANAVHDGLVGQDRGM